MGTMSERPEVFVIAAAGSVPAAEAFAARVRAALLAPVQRTVTLLWVDSALGGDISAVSAATRAYHEARLSQGSRLLVPVYADGSPEPESFPRLGGVDLETTPIEECAATVALTMERV